MTSFRTGRGEQPPLFPSDGTRSPGRRRKAAAGRHRKEDLMERDRTRRPLFELDEVPQAAKIKVIGLGGGGSNAVSRMMAAEFTGVEFIVANTRSEEHTSELQSLTNLVCSLLLEKKKKTKKSQQKKNKSKTG